jgi:hypothetical protein
MWGLLSLLPLVLNIPCSFKPIPSSSDLLLRLLDPSIGNVFLYLKAGFAVDPSHPPNEDDILFYCVCPSYCLVHGNRSLRLGYLYYWSNSDKDREEWGKLSHPCFQETIHKMNHLT